jgi:hypothetical protein
MADMAASVLSRLKNKAKESGRSYQLCLQLFSAQRSKIVAFWPMARAGSIRLGWKGNYSLPSDQK